MRFDKLRAWGAALCAFLLGVPLTERAVAQVGDIIGGSLRLTEGILRSADRS
ncbi:MAG: hypothetical protein IPM18_02150 [Phycisphaerales bacterium]|nr:hypothetical protein [Phycisphaerales bacterium]